MSHVAKSSGPGTASPGVTPPVSGSNTRVMWWKASAELSTGSSGVGSISTWSGLSAPAAIRSPSGSVSVMFGLNCRVVYVRPTSQVGAVDRRERRH